MTVDIQVEAFRDCKELHDILAASARYLASRDRDPESEARALWRLWADANGEARIGLELRERGYSQTYQFSPSQLTPANIRELRLLEAWDGVLKQRIEDQFRRTNELIAQMDD